MLRRRAVFAGGGEEHGRAATSAALWFVLHLTKSTAILRLVKYANLFGFILLWNDSIWKMVYLEIVIYSSV